MDFVRRIQWGHVLTHELTASGNRFGFLASAAWPPRGMVPTHILDFSKRVIVAARHLLFSDHSCYRTQNLSSEESTLLRCLSTDRSIVIRPADKGGRWVVMDWDHYSGECLRLLHDTTFYRPLDRPPDARDVTPFSILSSLRASGHITRREFRFLTSPTHTKERIFKALPKIHKDVWPSPNMPPGRPIIADVNSETSNVSRLVEFFLFPLARSLPSFLMDSTHLIALLKGRSLSPSSLLCSLDVRSLYTNVPIDEGISRVASAFGRHPDSSRPDQEVLDLLRLCLTSNDFLFDGQRFQQISGVQMGKAFGGSFANLYMGHWEASALNSHDRHPDLWLRYQDDVFFVWSHGESALASFLHHLNSLDEHIQVDLHYSPTNLRFLDLELYRQPDHLIGYRIGFKDTDCHRLLHHDSHHPPHVHKAVVYSQILRWAYRSSTFDDFRATCNTVFPRLRLQGVSRALLRNSLRKVWRLTGLRSAWRPGFSPCQGSRCSVCALTSPCSTVRVAASNSTFPILHRLDCASTHCVYVLLCMRCGKRYVGQTSNRLGTRITQHLRSIRLSPNLSSLTAHFNSECSSADVRFFGLERALSSDTRLLKEARWIRLLRTVAPSGLNDNRGTVRKKFSLVTRRADCTDRLNSLIRRACRGLNIPFRCAYTTDKNLGRHLT